MALGDLVVDHQPGSFEHTDNRVGFYGPNDTWWVVMEQSDGDHSMWEWDGTANNDTASAGAWSQAQEAAVGNLVFPSSSDARPTVAWDSANSILGYLKQDTTIEVWRRYQYNSGTNDWTQLTNSVTTPAGVNTDELKISLGIDSNGYFWLWYRRASDGVHESRYCDIADDDWKNGGTGDTDTLTGGSFGMSAIQNWVDDDGDAGLIIGFSCSVSSDDQHRVAFRKDSALLTANWTTEQVTTSHAPDGHSDLVALVCPGDTESTVIYAEKTTTPYQVFRRAAGGAGGWDSAVDIGSGTRNQLMADETNGTVRILDTQSTAVFYKEADASAALSFGSWTKIFENDGVTTFSEDIGTPSHNCSSVTGWMTWAKGNTKGWWAHEAITTAALEPGVGALTLTGKAPTVTVSMPAIEATPDKASLTLTGKAPSATRTQNFTTIPDIGALQIEGKIPDVAVTTPGQVIAMPPRGGLTIEGRAPTVTLSTNVMKSPGVAALSLTGKAPSETHMPTMAFDTEVAGLSIEGFAPSVTKRAPIWVIQPEHQF